MSPIVPSIKAPPPPPVSRPRKNSTYGLSQTGLVASAAAQGKVIAAKEGSNSGLLYDMEFIVGSLTGLKLVYSGHP